MGFPMFPHVSPKPPSQAPSLALSVRPPMEGGRCRSSLKRRRRSWDPKFEYQWNLTMNIETSKLIFIDIQFIFIENSMEIEWKYQWTFWIGQWYSLIFKLWNKYIYIYKYPMNMNEYLWNSGYWWWNLIHNSCIRIFDWWLIGLWSLGSLFLSNPWYSQKMGASMGPHYHQ